MDNSSIKNLFILIGSFITLIFFGLISELYNKLFGIEILVGAFGASTAILFNSPDDKISSYKRMTIGYLISCFIGINLNYFLSENFTVLKIALSVSIAIYLMRSFRVFHPAGGAIALLATTYQYKLPIDLLLYFVGTSVIGPSVFYLIVLLVRRIQRMGSK